jgi:hypothetical protein
MGLPRCLKRVVLSGELLFSGVWRSLLVGLGLRRLKVSFNETAGFLLYVAFEIVLVSLLFLYWATKMTGPLYNFNGFFFFSVHLLLLFITLCIVLDGVDIRRHQALTTVVACGCPMLMFAAKPVFSSRFVYSDTEVAKITSTLLAEQQGEVRLTFLSPDSPVVAGVASRIKRSHRSFCVDPVWGFMFGQQNVCAKTTGLTNVMLGHDKEHCMAPCRTLLQDDRFTVQVSPFVGEPSVRIGVGRIIEHQQ